MNLYFRLFWTILRALFLPPLKPGDALTRTMRVLPNDVDLNFHMNNGRYLTIVDLALVEYFVRTGFVRALLKKRWRPMSGGTVVTFRRGLGLFQPYQVVFQLQACDTYWNFMRFDFLELNGRLCASGYMKGAAVGREGLIENTRSYAQLGLTPPSVEPPEAVAHWLQAENAVMQQRGAKT